MMSGRNAEAHELCHQLEGEMEVTKQQNIVLEKNLALVGRRCVRAESMAAAFESQLKQCRPDLVIDYTFKIIEPSLKLFEVISSADEHVDENNNDSTDGLQKNSAQDLKRFLKEISFT